MTLTIALAILTLTREELPVSRGWHLDGPGPARYGWGYRHATGRVTYLGETWVGVRDAAERVQALALLRAAVTEALAEGGAS